MKMRSVLLLILLSLPAYGIAQEFLPVGVGMNGTVRDFIEYNGELYACGDFTTGNGDTAYRIAKWVDTTWVPLSGVIDNPIAEMEVYNGKLYIAGGFGQVDGMNIPFIASWDGSNWDTVGTGAPNIPVFCLKTYKGKLYAGGPFTLPASRIVSWNDTVWAPLTAGVISTVLDLEEHNGLLYVCGSFTMAGGTPANYIASWDGSNWDSLGGGMDKQVVQMASYKGALVASGDFSTAGGSAAAHIASWDGINWNTLGSGLDTFATDFMPYGNRLFAGGIFKMAGGSPANNIASWDGSLWATLGSGTNASVAALQTVNDQLYVGGDFTTAGDSAHNYIAIWDECTNFTGGFMTSVEIGTVNVAVDFTDTTLGFVDNWNWDFGDTGSDTIQNPSYTYSGNGFFTVQLIVGGGACMDTVKRTLEVNWPVGISEFTETMQIRIYPNPSSDKVYINFRHPLNETLNLELYDMAGKRLEQATRSLSKGIQSTSLMLDGLASGLYMLKLSNRSELKTKKLIKK